MARRLGLSVIQVNFQKTMLSFAEIKHLLRDSVEGYSRADALSQSVTCPLGDMKPMSHTRRRE